MVGTWSPVFLQLPTRQAVPAGIILWDPSGDKLLVAFRPIEDLVDVESEVLEFWTELPEFLLSMAEDGGGLQTLNKLEDEWSHVLQIGARQKVDIQNSASLLRSLMQREIEGLPDVAFYSLEAKPVQVPLLGSNVVRLLAAVNDPLLDYRTLESLISQDVTISANLIRLANSGALPLREAAKTVSSAIQRLGLDTTKMLVIGLSLSPVYSSPKLRKLWNHSIEVAQKSRRLASQAKLSSGEASLVGLVHDIGRAILLGSFPESEADYSLLQAAGLTERRIEMTLYSQDHCLVGATALRAWHFPKEICDGVLQHHAPSGTNSKWAALLYLAEATSEHNEDVFTATDYIESAAKLGLHRFSPTEAPHSVDFDLRALRASG